MGHYLNFLTYTQVIV